MSANFNDEDDEAWLYGAAAPNEEATKTKEKIINKPLANSAKDINNGDFMKEDQSSNHENLILQSSQAEMFDFEESNKDVNKEDQQIDQNPNEINYDVDPTLQEACQEEEEGVVQTLAPTDNEFQTKESSDNAQDNKDGGDPDDSDSDEDDEDNMVNVVISDIVNKPYSTQASSDSGSFLNRQKSHTLTTQASTTAVQAAGAVKPVAVKGVDVEAPGTINELPTFEYDLQEVKDEDKPWRMPGADITDYFNYGFTEESWIQYCMKQKRLRAENCVYKNMNGVNVLVPIQSTVPGFPNTNGFNNGVQGQYPGYQNRMNTPFQPRFQSQQQTQSSIPQGNFIPRKIGQVGGVDVLSTRPVDSGPPRQGGVDFSAPPPGWAIGAGGPPPQQQTAGSQAGMMPRSQLPPPVRGSSISIPPPQMPASTGIQMMQQPNYQNPQFAQSSYGFPPPVGTNVSSAPPTSLDRPFNPNSLPPPIYNQPPPFNRLPENRLPVSMSSGPTWEKPTTVEQQSYNFNDGNRSPSSRYRRSSRSSTPGVNSPKRRQHSKSPNEATKYSRDQENKSSSYSKHRRDYSSKDHRRSPSSPSRRSYRHRDHDRRDYDKRRSRDKDRSRSRDRSRDKSRDKSRDRSRSRDDKHKKRRKSNDDDRLSSKSHKRSKKSSRKEHDKDIEKDLIKIEPGTAKIETAVAAELVVAPVVKQE